MKTAPLSFRRSALTAALSTAFFITGAAQAATVTTTGAAGDPGVQTMTPQTLTDSEQLAAVREMWSAWSGQYFDLRLGEIVYFTDGTETVRPRNTGNSTGHDTVLISTGGTSGNTLTAALPSEPAGSPGPSDNRWTVITGGLAGGEMTVGNSDPTSSAVTKIALNPGTAGAASGDTSNNAVSVTGAEGVSRIYGGLTMSGSADNNTVVVTGDAGKDVSVSDIIGGAGLNTSGNKVTVKADYADNIKLIAGSVGVAGGTHGNNTVNVTAGGGNIGIIAGTKIEFATTGVQSSTTAVPEATILDGGDNNTVNVTLSNNTHVGHVYGGLGKGNTVTVTGEGRGNMIFGGQFDNNTVTVDLDSTSGFAVIAGSVLAGGSHNTLIINNAIAQEAFGARSGRVSELQWTGTEANHVDTSYNTVIQNGGMIGFLCGGYSDAVSNANYNTVIVNDTELPPPGPGFGMIVGGYSGEGDAIGNTVEINGGTTMYAVAGGWVDPFGDGKASDNTVIIRNAPDLTRTTLFGAYIEEGGHPIDPSRHSNNTLEVFDGDHVAKQIYHFDNLVFHIPADVSNGHAMLTLTDENGTDISNTNVAAYVQAGARGHNLQAGDRVQLIANENGVTAENVTRQNFVARAGVALQHEFDLEATDTSLDAVLTRTTAQPDTTVVNTARTTALSTLAQMVDFTQNQSLRCPKDADGNQSLTCLWAAAGGTNYRYDMGANADYNRVHGSQFVMGVRGKLNDSASDEVTGAAFFETGRAKFKSAGLNSKATGDNEFYGFGTILRWAATDGALKGLYAEGNAQLGWSTSDMNAQLADSTYNVKFHNKAFGGAGLGAGYVFDLTNSLSLDTYARYQWTRINGGKVNVEGETFKFDSVDSQRARVGTRLEAAPSATFRAYVGAAFEREFDGKSTATIQGYDVNPTTLRGNYGLGEIGVRYTPADSKGWTFEGNLTGFAGKKDGFTGNITAAYKF